MLSSTWIVLLEALKYFEHHNANSGTPKTYGMHPDFTNPIVLRCLEVASSEGRSKHQLYALDHLNFVSIFSKELNVSPQNDSFFFFPIVLRIKILTS